MPEQTLLDLADHGEIGELLPADGGDAAATLARLAPAGVDVGALAAQLQQQGADGLVQSWNELLASIAAKGELLTSTR
jgi:transaldolase